MKDRLDIRRSAGPAVALALALVLVAGCSRDSSSPPGEDGPRPLEAGQARLTPEQGTVAGNDTVVLHLNVHSGEQALGAVSLRLFFDDEAFELVSVQAQDGTLSDPFLQAESPPGSLYLGWTNTSDPDADLTGERRVADLTFRAVGEPGAKMNLSGRILSMGDTAFPAEDIGEGAFPRTLDVAGDVAVARG